METYYIDLQAQPTGQPIDHTFSPQVLAEGYEIAIEGVDGNGNLFMDTIMPPPILISEITSTCDYNLGLTVSEDGSELIINGDGQFEVGDYTGKKLHFSLDSQNFEGQDAGCQNTEVKRIVVRDRLDLPKIIYPKQPIHPSHCEVNENLVCTDDDPTQCSDDGRPMNMCGIVIDDDDQENTVVIRCDEYNQNTGANTCMVNKLANGQDPTFWIDGTLNFILDGFLRGEQLNFDLSAEDLAQFGIYQDGKVSLTFYSIVMDGSQQLQSHLSTYVFVIDKKPWNQIVIKDLKKPLLDGTTGMLRIPLATLDSLSDPNCAADIGAYLYLYDSESNTWQKVSEKKNADGTDSFPANLVHELAAGNQGALKIGYELACANNEYRTMHPENVQFVVIEEPEGLPPCVRPVLYAPNEQEFNQLPVNLGANPQDLTPNVDDNFYLTVEFYDDDQCERVYDGDIVYQALSMSPMLNFDKCEVDNGVIFTCPSRGDRVQGEVVTCTYVDQSGQDADVDCTAFEIMEQDQYFGVICRSDLQQTQACFIAKYSDEVVFDPSNYYNQEANYYAQVTKNAQGMEGIPFSPILSQFSRFKDQNPGNISPYLFTIFFNNADLPTIHRTQITFENLESGSDPLLFDFSNCNLDKSQRADNEQIRVQYFQEFNEEIGPLAQGSNVRIPAMSRENCIYKYGIAERGYCNLKFLSQDELSPSNDEYIGYGRIAKFMMEETSEDSGPFYYGLFASCLRQEGDEQVYEYVTYEAGIVQFGEFNPSHYEGDQTEDYEIVVTVTDSNDNDLKNQALDAFEIVVGAYNNPAEVLISTAVRIEKFQQATYDFEFIRAQTVVIAFDEEQAALRLRYPEIYGMDVSEYTKVQQSDQFDCTVESFDELSCQIGGEDVDGPCRVFRGSVQGGDPTNYGGCCFMENEVPVCKIDVEDQDPSLVIFEQDSYMTALAEPFNELMMNAEVMYRESDIELVFYINLGSLLATIAPEEHYEVRDVYLFLTVMNSQTGQSQRHRLHSSIIFNYDPCPQNVVANQQFLLNAMALEHPIKTVFEWNEPIEIEGMPVNGHTLTARIVEDMRGWHDTQGVEGNHVLQIVATNGQDTFTYLSSPLAFLEPGQDDQIEGACYSVVETLLDANDQAKQLNFEGNYEIDLNPNTPADAMVNLIFVLAGTNPQNCNYQFYRGMVKTFSDLELGQGDGGYVYPSQCHVRPSGLECFEHPTDPQADKLCKYGGQQVDHCDREQTFDGIEYYVCREEDEFGNSICGIWVSDEFKDSFVLPPEQGLIETQNVFNGEGVTEPVFEPDTQSYIFTAANVKTLFDAQQVAGDYESKFYGHAVVKNLDSNKLEYVRMSFHIKFYNGGSSCNIDDIFDASPIADGVLLQEVGKMTNFRATFPDQKIEIYAEQAGSFKINVACVDYQTCSLVVDDTFDREMQDEEAGITYSFTEALIILMKEGDCFINLVTYDDQLAEQGSFYVPEKLHLYFPQPPYPEPISPITNFIDGQNIVDGYQVNLETQPDLDMIYITTQPDENQIQVCVFTYFSDLQNFARQAAQRIDPFMNSCPRIYAPEPTCTVPDQNDPDIFSCIVDQTDYAPCVETKADLEGDTHYACYNSDRGVDSCILLSSTRPYPEDKDMFEPESDQELKTKSKYNEVLGNQDEQCQLALSIEAMKQVWQDESYQSQKDFNFFASYFVTQPDGSESIIQNPITLTFILQPPQVSADPQNFRVERFSKMISFDANESELEVDISINTQNPVFNGRAQFLKIALMKKNEEGVEQEMEIFMHGASSYTGAPFTYLEIAQHAGAILADGESRTRNIIFFRLTAIDVISGNPLAMLDSEDLVMLPPTEVPTYEATDCVISKVAFTIADVDRDEQDADFEEYVKFGRNVLVKEIYDQDGNMIGHQDLKLTFSPPAGAECPAPEDPESVEHECLMLPFDSAFAIQAFGHSIYFNDALCEYINPYDPERAYVQISEDLIHLRDSSGNSRYGHVQVLYGYLRFMEEDTGYCGVVTADESVMDTLKSALGTEKVDLLQQRTLQDFESETALVYDVISGDLMAENTGKTDLYLHCLSKARNQEGELTSINYNRIDLTVIFQTQLKYVYDMNDKLVHFGKNLQVPFIALTPYWMMFKNYQIQEVHLRVYNHQTQDYETDDDPPKKVIQSGITNVWDVFMPYDELLIIQSMNMGFYELEEYAKYDLNFKAVLKDTTDDSTEEFRLDGAVTALPPYQIHNELLQNVKFDINKPDSENAVKYIADQYGRPAFEIWDYDINLDNVYNLDVDFSQDQENQLVGFHVNNQRSLIYYCQNSYRWGQEQSDSSCPDFPSPDSLRIDFDSDQCDHRTGICETEHGRLENCEMKFATLSDPFWHCSFGPVSLAQNIEVHFDDTTLFRLGDLYNYVEEGQQFATSSFKPRDVESHFTKEHPEPFYGHAIYKREVANTDPVEFTFHYAILEFMLVGRKTELQLAFTFVVGNGEFYPVPQELSTGFDQDITLNVQITSTQIEDPQDWYLTCGVLEQYEGGEGSFFKHRFGDEQQGQFEQTISQIDLLREVGFEFEKIGCSGRHRTASQTNLVQEIDTFMWKIDVPAQGDQNGNLACLDYDLTMHNEQGLQDRLEQTTLFPLSFSSRYIDISVADACKDENVPNDPTAYFLQIMKISDVQDLTKHDDSTPSGRFFEDHEPQIAEDTTDNSAWIYIDEIRSLRQAQGSVAKTFYIHAIFKDHEDNLDYIMRPIGFDFTDVDSQNTGDSCDGQFTKFEFDVYYGSVIVNTKTLDEECDDFSQKKGGKLQSLEHDFNSPMELHLVPKLTQCGAVTQEYLVEGYQPPFNWNAASNEVFIDDKEPAYDRLTSNWIVRVPGCDDDECKVQVDSSMIVRLTPVEQVIFQEGYDAHFRTFTLQACNTVWMTDKCIEFYMPRLRAPPMSEQFEDFITVSRNDDVIKPNDNGEYEINTASQLTFTLRDGECEPLDGQFRTYPYLGLENSMRGIRAGDYDDVNVDFDCEIKLIQKVTDQQSGDTYYEDKDFGRYIDCDATPQKCEFNKGVKACKTDGVNGVICTETKRTGERVCYVPSQELAMPWDSPLYENCYNPDNFDQCELASRCVACRAIAKQDPESCDPTRQPQPGECLDTPDDECDEIEHYFKQVKFEEFALDNSRFEPKSNMNKLLRNGVFTEISVSFDPYELAQEFRYEENRHNGVMPPTPASDFPGDSNDVYAMVFCEGQNGEVNVRTQKFTFVEEEEHPEASEYGLRLNFPRAIDFRSPASFEVGEFAPPDRELDLYLRENGKKISDLETEYGPLEKYSLMEYRRESNYEVFAELRVDGITIESQKRSVMILPPTSEPVQSGDFQHPVVIMTQNESPLSNSQDRVLVKKDSPIKGSVYFENEDGEKIGKVVDIIIRPFHNLWDQCTYNGLCAPPQNDLCKSKRMICEENDGSLRCYDLNMNRIDRQTEDVSTHCYDFYDGCTSQARCDTYTYNQITQQMEISCLTAKMEELADKIIYDHPLKFDACDDDPTIQYPQCVSKKCRALMETKIEEQNPAGFMQGDECYLNNPEISRSETCTNSPERWPISSKFDNRDLFSFTKQEDRSAEFIIEPKLWEDELGKEMEFFMTIIFQDNQGEMQFVVEDEYLKFLTSNDESEQKSLEFLAKYECQAIPFNSPYTDQVTIIEFRDQAEAPGYSILRRIGDTVKSMAHKGTDTISFYDLYKEYGGISPENSCEQEIVSYNAVSVGQVDSSKSYAQLVLQFPDANVATGCLQTDFTFKDISGIEVLKNGDESNNNAGASILNLNKEILVEFTHKTNTCTNGVTASPLQVIVTNNEDLHKAQRDFRDSYTSPPPYDGQVVVMHDYVDGEGNQKCKTLRNNDFDCANIEGTTIKLVNVGRRCFVQNQEIPHPLSQNSGFSDLAACYEPDSTCLDGISTDCMKILKYKELPTWPPPNDNLYKPECDELESIFEQFQETNSRCKGNLTPLDTYDLGSPPNYELEKYLRSMTKVPGKRDIQAMKLNPDMQYDTPTGVHSIFVHTISEVTAADGTKSLGYAKKEWKVELFRQSEQAPESSLDWDTVIFYGESLVVEDDLSTSDKSGQNVMTIQLEPPNCAAKTFALDGDVLKATYTYLELVECYKDKLVGSGLDTEAIVKRTVGNKEYEMQIHFTIIPPMESTSYSECDNKLTVSVAYKDGTAITPGASGYELTNENKNKGNILITLDVPNGQNDPAGLKALNILAAYGVGDQTLASYVLSQVKEAAISEQLYCDDEDSSIPEGTHFSCHNHDFSYTYDTCVTDGGCTYCEHNGGAVSRDENNPHPRKINIYEGCYNGGDCPVIPYCLDRRINPATVMTEENLNYYPLLDLVETFGLYEAWPEIDWQSIDEDKKTKQFKDQCIDLPGMIRNQEPYWYNPCQSMYDESNQYSPFYRTNAPFKCDDGSSASDFEINNIIAAFDSLEYTLTISSVSDKQIVLELDEEFVQIVRSDSTNIPQNEALTIQIVTIAEPGISSGPLSVCRNAINLKFEVPGVEVTLSHPELIPNGLYSTLEFYQFTGQAIDHSPNKNYELSCSFMCTGGDFCPPSFEANQRQQHFWLTSWAMNNAIASGTQEATFDYVCASTHRITGETTTERAGERSFNFRKDSFDEICEVEEEEEYLFYYDDGITRKARFYWREPATDCIYSGIEVKVRETGAACSWCGVSDRTSVKTAKNDAERKYIEVMSNDIPLNQEINLDVKIIYTKNGNQKEKVMKITVLRYKEITFDCLVQDGMYFEGEDITNSIVVSDSSVSNYKVLGWKCPVWVNQNKRRSLDRSYSFSGTALSPLDIPTGEYEFCAQILYQGTHNSEVCCQFQYINERKASSNKRPFRVEIEYPVGADRQSMKNVDFDFILSNLEGSFQDLFDYVEFFWTLYEQNDAEEFIEMEEGLIVGFDVYGYVSKDSLSPNKRYRLEVRGQLADGSEISNRLEFLMSGPLEEGSIRIENMVTGNADITDTSDLRILFDRFRGIEDVEILTRPKGSSDEPSLVKFGSGGELTNVRLPRSDVNEIIAHYVDTKGWDHEILIFDEVRVGTPFADIESYLANLDFGSAAKLKDEIVSLFPGENVDQKLKEKFEGDFVAVKDKRVIDDDGTKDPGKINEILESLNSYMSLGLDDDDIEDYLSNNGVDELFDDAFSTDLGASQKQQEKAIEKAFKIGSKLNGDSSSGQKLQRKLDKNMMSHIHNNGGFSVTDDKSQMTGKKLKSQNLRNSKKVKIKNKSTTSMPASEIDINTDDFKRLCDNLGVQDLSIQSKSQTLPASALNVIPQDNSFLDIFSEILVGDGTNLADITGLNIDHTFDGSEQNRKPRSLATVTTTVTTPVCYRYDSTTSSWTTNGVTTTENGSQVQCSTSLSGAIMVQYTTTTTTTTTPEPTSSGSGTNVGLIVGLVVALVVIAVGVTLAIIFIKKAQKKKRARRTASTKLPMFTEDNTDEIKREKFEQAQVYHKQGSTKSLSQGAAARNVVDASVTEMRPMAADDSFDKPSELPVPILPIVQERRSYVNVEDSDPKVEGPFEAQKLEFKEQKDIKTERSMASLKKVEPEVKAEVKELLPEEMNLQSMQPQIPEESKIIESQPEQSGLKTPKESEPVEPNQDITEEMELKPVNLSMALNQPDAASEAGSGKGLLAEGIPESNVNIEDL